MVRMWKTEGRGCRHAVITPADVVRETKRFVYVPTGRPEKPERREARSSEWRVYHQTWDAAHEYLTRKAADRIVAARRALELANAFAGNVKGLRKPAEVVTPAESEG